MQRGSPFPGRDVKCLSEYRWGHRHVQTVVQQFFFHRNGADDRNEKGVITSYSIHYTKLYDPTRIVFGPDSFAQLPSLLPAEARVLLLYGGGSIKQNGVYDGIRAALAGRDIVEFGGVEANPTQTTLDRAVDLVRREKVGS